MKYSILSNGTLVDEYLLKQFETGKRRLRLNYIQISIDGSSAEINNLSRPKSFERAINGLKLLKEAKFPVTAPVTINRYDLFDLENIAILLLDEIGLQSFGTNEAMPMGAGCRNMEQVTLTSKEMKEAMQILDRLQTRYPGRITDQAGPIAKRLMYDEMEHARKTGNKPSRWEMGYLTSCGCVYSRIDVLHDGTIVPCHILSNLTLGNFTHDSLQEIWLNHSTMQALRMRKFIPMQQVAGCVECDWASYCNGSCPGMAYEMTGDFNQANPQDCYKRFQLETERNNDFKG
jgi:Fe-coproporphyrin III synthase